MQQSECNVQLVASVHCAPPPLPPEPPAAPPLPLLPAAPPVAPPEPLVPPAPPPDDPPAPPVDPPEPLVPPAPALAPEPLLSSVLLPPHPAAKRPRTTVIESKVVRMPPSLSNSVPHRSERTRPSEPPSSPSPIGIRERSPFLARTARFVFSWEPCRLAPPKSFAEDLDLDVCQTLVGTKRGSAARIFPQTSERNRRKTRGT